VEETRAYSHLREPTGPGLLTGLELLFYELSTDNLAHLG
jgi:hypothetical protein